MLKKTFQSLLDFLLPISCLGCGQYKHLICRKCLTAIKIESATVQTNDLTVLVSADYANPLVAKLIKTMKYQGCLQLAVELAYLLSERLKISGLQTTLLMPIPLHPRRHKRRGYNQSIELAKALGNLQDLTVNQDLVRIKNTASQAKLNRVQRLRNMQAAFVYQGPSLENKHILLIDDVLTTGATIEAASQAIKKAGAASVSALVIAKNDL